MTKRRAYKCCRCNKLFTFNDYNSLNMSCAVLHGANDCCHYSDKEVSPQPNHPKLNQILSDHRAGEYTMDEAIEQIGKVFND